MAKIMVRDSADYQEVFEVTNIDAVYEDGDIKNVFTLADGTIKKFSIIDYAYAEIK